MINGFYIVDGEIIENKIYAILRASEKKSHVQWHFYDDVFSKTKPNLTASLEDLYVARARQLRDTYDYLILNYSGGSDSHNILTIFLKNNIKLDHIYVQWPESLTDKGIYVPNSIDKSNANFHSEWDLVIKKDLEWVGKNYPNIKIEIGDWTTSLRESFYKDDLFSNNVTNLPSIARSQKQNTFSNTESKLALSGKKVGSIFGVDKIGIVKKGQDWHYYFSDTACMAQSNPDNPFGTEYFYWSPQFPEIPATQALHMCKWFMSHPDKQYLIKAKSERELEDPSFMHWPYDKHYDEFHQLSEIFKLVCYPYWDFNRFQAAKPFSQISNLPMGVRAWDNILQVVPEFAIVQQKWEYLWKSYLTKIDNKFMRNRDTVTVFKTKFHKISSSTLDSFGKINT